MNKWQLIDQTTPVDTTAAPFDGERVLLWMHPDTRFGAAFGYYTVTQLWGPCWRFEDEYTVEAPAGALWWQPVPEAPTDPAVNEPDDEDEQTSASD